MNSVERKRHLAKAVTWRVVAGMTTAALAYIFGIPPKAIGAMVIVDFIIKFVLYYFHERAWYKFSRFGVKNVR